MTYRSTLTTLTALAGSLALTVGPAAGPAPSASSTTEIDVICDGIGKDTVTITGDLSSEAVLRSPPARCR